MSRRSDLRTTVILRDRQCVLALVDRSHKCADVWGRPQHPAELDKLTLEHVRMDAGGARLDDEGHCVSMCASANVNHEGSTTENRRLLNAYLAGVRAAS
jgi:hypothetical protein